MIRLGVNIDHVATLRNARGEDHPNILNAAKFVMKNGADLITIPPIAGDNIMSMFLNSFLIFFAKERHIFEAKLGLLNSFAHCTYFDECRPEDSTK